MTSNLTMELAALLCLKNMFSVFSRLLLIWYFLNVHVMKTYIEFWMISNFSQIGPLTVELAAGHILI